jgi:hypothetical protein
MNAMALSIQLRTGAGLTAARQKQTVMAGARDESAIIHARASLDTLPTHPKNEGYRYDTSNTGFTKWSTYIHKRPQLPLVVALLAQKATRANVAVGRKLDKFTSLIDVEPTYVPAYALCHVVVLNTNSQQLKVILAPAGRYTTDELVVIHDKVNEAVVANSRVRLGDGACQLVVVHVQVTESYSRQSKIFWQRASKLIKAQITVE